MDVRLPTRRVPFLSTSIGNYGAISNRTIPNFDIRLRLRELMPCGASSSQHNTSAVQTLADSFTHSISLDVAPNIKATFSVFVRKGNHLAEAYSALTSMVADPAPEELVDPPRSSDGAHDENWWGTPGYRLWAWLSSQPPQQEEGDSTYWQDPDLVFEVRVSEGRRTARAPKPAKSIKMKWSNALSCGGCSPRASAGSGASWASGASGGSDDGREVGETGGAGSGAEAGTSQGRGDAQAAVCLAVCCTACCIVSGQVIGAALR